jgi:DEAD/DEAH box helicase domain-containing protein
MFNGDLTGVTATNALELGVDIGGVDACVLTGYPGTVASTWQQAGRAGRRQGDALAVLVAADNPLDQFLMRRPDYFFGKSHEHAALDPTNRHILSATCCAPPTSAR